MKNPIKTILCGAAALFATTAAFAIAPSSATQFTPNMMNYQGHLYDPANGAYNDDTYEIECRIYRQETGGTPIWGGVYTVYVKDGYFNIMLGDSSATNLGYTYPNTELWRALWDDEDADVRNDLWLGITMRQDYRHNNIAAGSRSEISPRQRLLAGPYAFRAQAAHYAKEANDDFKVGGDITFASAPWTIGSRFKWDGTTLTLGVTDGSTPNSYSPAVKISGKNLNATTWGGIDLKSNSGDITLQASSGHSVNVKDGQFNVSNSKTEISSGSTKLEMTGSTITGIGNLQWAKTSSDTAVKPFVLKSYEVTVPSGKNSGQITIENNSNSQYNYTVVGFMTLAGGSAVALDDVHAYWSNPRWYLSVYTVTKPAANTTFRVHVLGIHKALSDDTRSSVTPAAE